MKSNNIILSNKESILKRLWENTITNEIGCRLWTGALNAPNGHGVVRLRRFGPKYYVHRLSAYIYHGLDIDRKTEQVNHKNICPNKNCWAPEHIYMGNQLENIQDSVKAKTHFTAKARY